MASKFTQASTVAVTQPVVAKSSPVETPKPAPTQSVESNKELEKRVEALEAKVSDLIAKLSRKMSF